jgi:hypothetical protein
MTDFRAIARARGLDIPEDQLDRIARPLELLEAAFRPLTTDLPPSLEPASGFDPEDRSGFDPEDGE